ncbi:hypothetical protein [Legionella waltersii]|nr:hypothetical protein [Legionella waltersii]
MTKSAICTYTVGGNNLSINKDQLNTLMLSITGVEIIDNIAVIKDLETFRKEHPFNTIVDSTDHSVLHNSFFSKSSPSLTSKDEPFVKGEVTSSSSSNLKPTIVSLDTLLTNCPGETLVYEGGLKRNNETNLKRLNSLKVYSPETINLTAQVIKNTDYYVLREWQMQLIRQIHEEVIAPAMSTFKGGQATPKYVLVYFETCIRSIMSNSTYNLMDTAFEHNYLVEGEPIPVEENYQVRSNYAKVMLKGFMFFLSDLPAESLGLNNLELEQWLNEFKTHITVHKNKLQSLLEDLFKLTICSGLMDHDYKLLDAASFIQGENYDFSKLHTITKAIQMKHTTLAYALSKLPPNYRLQGHSVEGFPHRVYSLKQTLKYALEESLKANARKPLSETVMEECSQTIIESLCHEFISMTNGSIRSEAAKLISHTIKSSDTDLYLCDEWFKAISACLKNVFMESSSPRGQNKFLEKWGREVCSLIMGFVRTESEKLQAPDHTELNTKGITP